MVSLVLLFPLRFITEVVVGSVIGGHASSLIPKPLIIVGSVV